MITVGYDLVEHAPSNWNPNARQEDRLHRHASRPRSTSTSSPRSTWSATSTTSSAAWREELRHAPRTSRATRALDDIVLGRFDGARRTTTRFPMQPPRALWEIRQALGRDDILISDVGLHKLWIARMFPAHEPNTVMIANGLAGMGIAAADRDRGQARAPRPQRGHGQRRRRLPDERAGARDGRCGCGTADRERDLGERASSARSSGSRTRSSAATSASTSPTPTSSSWREAFGMPAWRCESVDDFGRAPAARAVARRPSLIVLPIDYSLDVAISEELGTETVAA